MIAKHIQLLYVLVAFGFLSLFCFLHVCVCVCVWERERERDWKLMMCDIEHNIQSKKIWTIRIRQGDFFRQHLDVSNIKRILTEPSKVFQTKFEGNVFERFETCLSATLPRYAHELTENLVFCSWTTLSSCKCRPANLIFNRSSVHLNWGNSL